MLQLRKILLAGQINISEMNTQHFDLNLLIRSNGRLSAWEQLQGP